MVKKFYSTVLKMIIGIAVALSFCITTQAETTHTLTIALDWYINPDHAPLLVAQTQGFFKQAHLRVKFITPTEANEPLQLVAANKVNLALYYQPSIMEGIAHGLPIITMGALIPQPLVSLAVLAHGPHQTLKSLNYTTIGYSGSSVSVTMLKALLKHGGADINTINFINIKMDLMQMLLSRRVAAVYGFSRNIEPLQLAKMGVAVKQFFPEQQGIPSYGQLLFVANRNHLNPTVLNAFFIALTKATAYLKAHPQQSWLKAVQRYPHSLATTPSLKTLNHAIWLHSVRYFAKQPDVINEKHYALFEHFLLQHQLLPKPVTFKTFFHAELTK